MSELSEMKYYSDLRVLFTEEKIVEEVNSIISSMKNLINQKTALFVLAKRNGLIKEDEYSNPDYSISECKQYAKNSQVDDTIWISLKDVIVFADKTIKTGSSIQKNGKPKRWMLTTIEVTDGVENQYGGLDFIKIRTFGSEFKKIEQYDRLNLNNILLEHKVFTNEKNEAIHWSSLSIQKNSEIEFL